MKIGLAMPLPPPPPADAVDPAALARAAERLGFESFWCQEHIVSPVQAASSSRVFADGQVPGFLDPLIALARASAVTERILLGTATALAAQRHPLLLAKEVATLDRFSGGRVLLGVGAGWLREEMELFGVDFDHRWRQVREAVGAMKRAWTEDAAEFHGRYYDFPPVRCYPKPAQRSGPPVLLGGTAARVLERVVAWADGWVPNFVTPELIKESRARLDQLAAEGGRDPKSLSITVYHADADRDLIDRYAEAGAERVLVRPPVVRSEREALLALEQVAERVRLN